MDKVMIKRIGMSFFGVIVGAISVGIFKTAALGVDPFQSFMAGLDQLVPISFGTLYVIANVILLSFALITDRHYIGIATFINMFLVGYVTQFTYGLLQKVVINPSMVLRFVLLVLAVIIICFASAFYITADLGVSTYDAVALVLANKYKVGKFKYIRIVTDLVCIVIGIILFLLGKGEIAMIPTFVGIGTIITAFFMGPLIDFFNEKCAKPFLNGKNK